MRASPARFLSACLLRTACKSVTIGGGSQARRARRWRWTALAQGAAAFLDDCPDTPAAAAAAARGAAEAWAAARARPPGRRVQACRAPWSARAGFQRALPANAGAWAGAPQGASGPAAATAAALADRDGVGAADADGAKAASADAAPGTPAAGAGPMDVDVGLRAGPGAAAGALAPQRAPHDSAARPAAAAAVPGHAEPARAPAADGHRIASRGLLPAGWYVARSPGVLAAALAPQRGGPPIGDAAGGSAPTASQAAPTGPRWGAARARPAGAAAWQAPAPAGRSPEPATCADLRCCVRVMLRMAGRGVARAGAAVHAEAAAGAQLLAPASALEGELPPATPTAAGVIHAAGRSGASVPDVSGQAPGRAAVCLGPVIGFVTSEVPRGAPASRGAVAVCQAAPLLALRGGTQDRRTPAHVLVMNPAGPPARAAHATLCLEAAGDDVAAW